MSMTPSDGLHPNSFGDPEWGPRSVNTVKHIEVTYLDIRHMKWSKNIPRMQASTNGAFMVQTPRSARFAWKE